MLSRRIALLAFVLVTLASASVDADVIVLRDGSRVETRGAWEVQGSTVVFRDRQGRLASLQLGQVDLEASREATREEATTAATTRVAAPSTDRPARRAVVTVTDSDVARADPSVLPATPERDEATDEAPEAPGHVAVTGWEKLALPGAPGVTVSGTVRNASLDTVGSLRVQIELFDEDGASLGSTTAGVHPAALPPEATGRFQVQVSEVPDFANAHISVESVAIGTAPPQPAVVPRQAHEQRQADDEPDR